MSLKQLRQLASSSGTGICLNSRNLFLDLDVLSGLGLLVLVLLPGEEPPQRSVLVVLVDVVVELGGVDLGVGLGALHVGVDLLADLLLHGLEEQGNIDERQRVVLLSVLKSHVMPRCQSDNVPSVYL